MQTLLQDLRYGIRHLLKSPGFTAVAVLSLALGIGANTALFSLADEILLKSLPVKNPEELVIFNWMSGEKVMSGSHSGNWNTDRATGLEVGSSLSYPAFKQFRARSRTLSDVFGFASLGDLNVNVGGQANIASGQLVTGNFHAGIGVRMALGRPITDDDDRPGADPVAVISYRYWERLFGLDPAVLGKKINVNNIPCAIVGVTPQQFYAGLQVGASPDLSLPIALEPRINTRDRSDPERSRLDQAWNWWVMVMGRMKPGVNAVAAQAELEGVLQQSALEGWNAIPPSNRPPDYGEPHDMPRLKVIAGGQGLTYLREAYEQPLRFMLIVVGLTLLVACANIANLLLARATARRQEIAVRLALGAGRLRLVRQLLTESMLLAVAGGALGCLLAWWAKDLLLMWHPYGGNPLDADLRLNWRVFGFTATVAVFTGALFGLAPALRATRVDLNSALKEDARGARGSLSLLGKSLVVAQVAVSLVLLVGAGLFIRTLHNLRSVDLGFNADNLLLFRVEPRAKGYKDDKVTSLCQQIIERIEAVPGARSVTVSEFALLSGAASNGPGYAQGRDPLPRGANNVYRQTVGWDYFETMGITLLAGRPLNRQDDEHAPRVAVINQTMARRFFSDENPLGKRFGLGKIEDSGEFEIVGVVRDAKYARQRQNVPSTAYFPLQQHPLERTTFAVRTDGDPKLMIAAIREAVRQVDKDLPVFAVKTQAEQANQALAKERFFPKLTALFGLLALLLASIGLYGVMSYAVEQRTREIGIRMALGATPENILRRVIGQGMLLATIGVVIGAAAAFALTRLITSNAAYELTRFIYGFLYGVRSTDPTTFVVVALLLTLVALLACYLPARRATKVDPMVALRCE